MSAPLFPHNQDAYESAAAMLAETGRAAIIHPTGTGKSFIGFKLCEDYRDAAVCWLSPSDYIYRTQTENWKSAGGEVPENIKFFTYAKLMNMSEEEIRLIEPSLIVLDEFHRAGAEMWGRGVQTLLSVCEGVPVLGLSATAVRYLDIRRNMADELFDGNVASEISLGEAIVRGILTPPKYVLSVFSFYKELENYLRRAEKLQNPYDRDRAIYRVEMLKRALEKSYGMDVIFEKHITERTGKYILFCSSFTHMKAMMDKQREWFGKIDDAPHTYYVYSGDLKSMQSFDRFKADNDNSHLRLLYCIDTLNEGIHVDDVSGVILLRPTVSPIVYKQQIGRAMSAGKPGETVVFDIVANISGLYGIDSVMEEMLSAIEYYRYLGCESEIVNKSFCVIDEVRNCKELFDELESALGSTWEQMYEAARVYYEENGNLLPPRSYVTEQGCYLGRWVGAQRSSYHRHDPALTPQRIAMLEEIGMSWLSLRERFWEESYSIVKEYYNKRRSLDGLAAYSRKAYSWTLLQRRKFRDGSLTEEQVERLNEVGMVWEPEDVWQRKFEAAREYFTEHGNLDIPAGYVTRTGIGLGVWYRGIRNQYREGTLCSQRLARLESIGFDPVSVKTRVWMSYYREVKAYFEANGNSDVSSDYVTDSGLKLGVWVSCQRYACSKGSLSREQTELLDDIGFSWQRDDSRWQVGFDCLEKYLQGFGNANVPSGYVTPEGFELGRWTAAQRTRRRQGKLSAVRIDKLTAAGFCWDPADAAWNNGFDRARAYYADNGNLNVPASYTEEDGFRLGAWISAKRSLYRRGSLPPERAAQLEGIGMVWDVLAYLWQTGYDHAREFYLEKGHLQIPKGYTSPDGYALFNWIDSEKKKHRSGKQTAERAELLREIGFVCGSSRVCSECGAVERAV